MFHKLVLGRLRSRLEVRVLRREYLVGLAIGFLRRRDSRRLPRLERGVDGFSLVGDGVLDVDFGASEAVGLGVVVWLWLSAFGVPAFVVSEGVAMLRSRFAFVWESANCMGLILEVRGLVGVWTAVGF